MSPHNPLAIGLGYVELCISIRGPWVQNECMYHDHMYNNSIQCVYTHTLYIIYIVYVYEYIHKTYELSFFFKSIRRTNKKYIYTLCNYMHTVLPDFGNIPQTIVFSNGGRGVIFKTFRRNCLGAFVWHLRRYDLGGLQAGMRCSLVRTSGALLVSYEILAVNLLVPGCKMVMKKRSNTLGGKPWAPFSHRFKKVENGPNR